MHIRQAGVENKENHQLSDNDIERTVKYSVWRIDTLNVGQKGSLDTLNMEICIGSKCLTSVTVQWEQNLPYKQVYN